MDKIKLGIKLYIQNLKLNIFIIIQLIAAMLIFVNFFSILEIYNYSGNMVEKLDKTNTIYYMPHNALGFEFEFDNELKELDTKELIKLDKTIQIYENNFEYESNIGRIVSYSDNYYDFLQLDLARGEKFSQHEGDYIEAYLINNDKCLKIGDEIQIYAYTNTKQTVYNKEFGTYEENIMKPFTLKIIGILKQPPQLFDLSTAGDVSFANMFKDYRSSVTGTTSIVINETDFKKNDFLNMGSNNKVFIYRSDISENERAFNKNILSNTGKVLSFEEISNSHKDELLYHSTNLLPFLILISIISLVGLIGTTIVFTTKSIRKLQIFFLCGASWKNCIGIIISNIVYNIIFSGIPTTLFLIISLKYNILFTNYIYISNSVIAYSWIMFLVYFITSILAPIAILGKNDPKRTLKYIRRD